MQPIVTPERWYITFWIVMGVGYAVLERGTGLRRGVPRDQVDEVVGASHFTAQSISR
jgi:hypothetical protein